MAKARQENLPEAQEEPKAPEVTETPPEVQEEPKAVPATQVILSRGDNRKAAQEQRLGFKFPEGKKEQLPSGTTVYRY